MWHSPLIFFFSRISQRGGYSGGGSDASHVVAGFDDLSSAEGDVVVVVELLVAEGQGDGAVELFRLVRWLRDPDLEPHHFARVLDELAVIA